MAKMKINNLDQLEKLVLNPKITKVDKYQIFRKALQSFPILFIEIISDDTELENNIEDTDNTLIPKMQKIISEIRADPTAGHYSGMSVIRNGPQQGNEPPDTIIDFTD